MVDADRRDNNARVYCIAAMPTTAERLNRASVHLGYNGRFIVTQVPNVDEVMA